MFGKGMSYQGGLSGLARSGDHNHWIAVGEMLKPGFRVSGDEGHGGFWLLYMPTLCGEMANCQCDSQLAWKHLFSVIHYLQEQEGVHLEVKARKVTEGAVYQCSIGNFFKHFEGFSEHGISHGIYCM